MEFTEIRTPSMMDFDKYSGHRSVRCLFPEGSSHVSPILQTPRGNTPEKSSSITPFSVSDIIRPRESFVGNNSLDSDDSGSDALHIDLDVTRDDGEAGPTVPEDSNPSAVNATRGADDSSREADDSSRGADDSSRGADDSGADDGEVSRLIIKKEHFKPDPASLYPQHLHHPYHFPGYPLPPSYQTFHPQFPSAIFPPSYPGGMLPFSPFYASMPPTPMHAYPALFGSSTYGTEDVGVVYSGPASPRSEGRVSPSDSLSSSSGVSSNSSNSSPTSSSDVTPTDTTIDGSSTRTRAPVGRTCYVPKQVRAMEKVFLTNRYPDYEVFEAMSDEIGIPTKKIKVWFQNKRARSKSRFPEVPYQMMPSGFGYPASHCMTSLPFPPRPMMPVYPGYPYPTFPSLVS